MLELEFGGRRYTIPQGERLLAPTRPAWSASGAGILPGMRS